MKLHAAKRAVRIAGAERLENAALHKEETPENDEVPLNDEAIVKRILAGDRASFELLMRRYNQRLFRITRSIVGNAAEAEDVMQEAYLRAYRHLHQFEGRSKFATWLTKIAVHTATARRKRENRLQLVTGEVPDHGSEQSMSPSPYPHRTAIDEMSNRELHKVLTRAIEALPSDLRVVFVLRAVEGLSTSQAAECLNLTAANVKVRLHRARSLLQTWIDRQIGEEARRLYVFDGADCDRVVENVLRQLTHDAGA